LTKLVAIVVLASTGFPAAATAAFPGVNGRIAYSSNGPGGSSWDIQTVNPDGGALRALTNDPDYDSEPEWSPDGSRIAFESGRAPGGSSEIYVMGAEGGGLTRVTNNAATDYGPAWSPGGGRIAFQSDRDANFEIYVMNADGGNVRRLTLSPTTEDLGPTWSPDGTLIAFTRDGGSVWIMREDGGAPAKLTDGSQPDWSPDGSRIAFERADGVWTIRPDGTGAIRVGEGSSPSWSPDGRRIAFSTPRDGNFEIYTMNADGGGFIRVTTDPSLDSYPDWQPLRPPPPPPPPPTPPPPTTSGDTTSGTTSGRTRVGGRVQFLISTSWDFFGSRTTVGRLALSDIPAKSRVEVRCRGARCPFRRWVKVGPRRVSLGRLFRGRRLPARTRIEIRVTKPGVNGTVVTYTLRARRVPAKTVQCLAPDAKRPVRRCSRR
jgi:dipeptidyl aminopeptidase/acylaminoacyl peptidase